ncbi:MAG TPA: substrate-binding domain-containing protein [Verrucomicrobiae bacterium]|nr:substrate-binding domain-containing protein [Verrucomicrobiae bacterium]
MCLSVVVCTVALAEPGSPAEPADSMNEAKRIEDEFRKLDETPVGKEIADLNAKINATYKEQEKERQALQEQYAKLRATEAYREYEKKQQELEQQRTAADEAARKAVAEAARQLYAARHDELLKLATKERPGARRLGFDVLTYPRVDGSTSTHPLSVIIASHVLGTAYEWIYPEPTGYPWHNRPNVPAGLFLLGMDTVPGSGPAVLGRDNYEFNLAASRTVAKPQRPEQDRVAKMINSLLATSSSTHDAYVNLIEGRCDLNLTARAMSADETRLAEDKGVKIELQPIARDALVFIVNQNNTVRSLTRQQIQGIYTEEIQKWDEVGGDARPIRALWRDRNSGSRELFDALVTKDQRPIPEPKDKWVGMFSNSMSGPFNRVTQDPQSLGYSVYYYEHYMALSPYTRMVAIEGVEPTPETIASGKYPYVTEVYAAYRTDESSKSPAMKLLAWLVSPEGQAVVRESGYVPAK